MSEAFPQVYLVRHGETAWTITGQHTGRTDIPLTERGKLEVQTLAPRLQGKAFALVLSSPLLRARQTAELAGFTDRVESTDDLLEWNYGAYEGRRTADIRAERPGWNLFEHGCPGGETVDDVGVRADRIIARLRSAHANALLFAHRDILRVVAARWVALPAREARRLYLEPTSVSILGYDHAIDEPLIRVLNGTV